MEDSSVLRWRTALTEAADLSGWTFKEGEDESKFINDIAEEISAKLLYRTYLNVAKYPIGIESRVREVSELLGVKGNSRCMVGIWGTPGIGKTTIAKAVYNAIAHKFEGSCFLANVRESAMLYGGLMQLQETLLHRILGGINLKVVNVYEGINVIKQRLRHKKILLVLDDVNKLEQLDNLAGSDWFGEGSRVIITTRDKGLLIHHRIELIYEVKKLDDEQALELFSLIAFERNEPPDDYLLLARRATEFTQCLPLALTVIGSYLRSESINHWHAILYSREGDPYEDIQKVLRISYDALSNRDRQVFLDIACFFKGEYMDYVIRILKIRNVSFPERCIQVLIQKALITVEGNWILMHDLLEQMGKDIVHKESPTKPGKRSRLWSHEDVSHVLTENTGTKRIKGIMIKWPIPDEIHLNANSFSGIKNLEFFINHGACLSGEVDYLPNKLRLIDWPGCNLQSLPSNFHPTELVEFNMPGSRITQLGEGFKSLTKLTTLNLSSCEFLTKVPDVSGIPNIKDIQLSFCTSLVEVDPSVGFLDKLVTLDLEGCSNLTTFPARVRWKSLRRFSLESCTRLERFPEIMVKMKFMKELRLGSSGIRELPPSIANLTGLAAIYAPGCRNLTYIPLLSIYELQHLLEIDFRECPKLLTSRNNNVNFETSSGVESPLPLTIPNLHCHSLALPELDMFNLHGCNLSVSDFLVPLDCLSLSILALSENNFVSLPECISKFVNLRDLYLFGCKRLREIPGVLPPKLSRIYVDNCTSLEKFPKLSSVFEDNDSQGFEHVDLMNCHRLCVNHGYDVGKIENMLTSQGSGFDIKLPGNEVPKWFNCRQVPNYPYEGPAEFYCGQKRQVICEFLIEIPENLEWDKSRLVLCAVFEWKKSKNDPFSPGVEICISGESGDVTYTTAIVSYTQETESTHVWLKYFPVLDVCNTLDRYWPKFDRRGWLLVKFLHRQEAGKMSAGTMSVKSCGVHLAKYRSRELCGFLS